MAADTQQLDGQQPGSGQPQPQAVGTQGVAHSERNGPFESIPAALVIARSAQKAWNAQPLARRLRIIRRLRHLIADHAEELAAAVDLPQRARAFETLTAEVLPLADSCRFLEREAPSLLKTRKLSSRSRPLWCSGIRIQVRREPLGVVLVIGPSNYPLMLSGVQAIQALVAGNAVILKPGRRGHDSAVVLRRLCLEAGLDPHLLIVLTEATEDAQRTIQAGVDKVVLTGSSRSGQAVLASLAESTTPAVMELSGCDPVFVLPGADLRRTIQAIRFGLALNGGETCIAPRRIFVHRSLAEELTKGLVEAASQLPAFPVFRQAADVGSRAIAEAVRGGAVLATGSAQPLAGPVQHHWSSLQRSSSSAQYAWFQPTVLTEVDPKMTVATSDLFVPVTSVIAVADQQQALEFAACSPYVLGASVFGPSPEAEQLATLIPAGTVTINDLIVPTGDPRMPFAGRGASGFGVTRGAEGLLEMTTLKAVAQRRGSVLPHLESPKTTDSQLALGLIQALHKRTLFQRVAGWYTLIRSAIAGRPLEVAEPKFTDQKAQ